MLRYVAIGHVAKDITAHGWELGGTVTYSARTARALGCDVSVVTSCERDLDLRSALPDIELIRQPSDRTTTFENVYTAKGRRQTLHAVADRLSVNLADDPRLWQSSPDIVHLAPIAQEVDRDWIDQFDHALIGVTPQGWLRQWTRPTAVKTRRGVPSGRVKSIGWANAEEVLRRADATIVSSEDINGDESIAQQWAAIAKVLVVTRGADGCTIFDAGRSADLPALSVTAIDPTGAGDIFAAAFFVRLRETRDPIAAGRFANCIAAQSITRVGLEGIPTRDEIEKCLK